MRKPSRPMHSIVWALWQQPQLHQIRHVKIGPRAAIYKRANIDAYLDFRTDIQQRIVRCGIVNYFGFDMVPPLETSGLVYEASCFLFPDVAPRLLFLIGFGTPYHHYDEIYNNTGCKCNARDAPKQLLGRSWESLIPGRYENDRAADRHEDKSQLVKPMNLIPICILNPVEIDAVASFVGVLDK
ncbi:hypothetical protein NHQ30_007182 [Ciborinia camelliae]|nr:hypothetical protein NHQ30_007182 [Ciborinia camelliae]